METNSQQLLINDFIIFLSVKSYNPKEIETETRNKLCNAYSDKNFRHSYSQIFATIKANVLEKDGSIDFLTENINTLSMLNNTNNLMWNTDVEKNNLIKSKIDKLYDHVMLEISRINYYEQPNGKYKDVESKIISANREISRANRDLRLAKQKMDSMRAESITVLSVFAAIMIASWGGTSFFSDILKSINSASIYRIIAVSCVSGFVLFNTVFLLVYMAARIMERSIYTFCPTAKEGEDCSLKEHKCHHNCWGINRIKKRLPYVFWVNMVLALLFFGDIVIYFLIKYGWLEGVYKLLVSTGSIIGIFILVICVVYTLMNVLGSMLRIR